MEEMSHNFLCRSIIYYLQVVSLGGVVGGHQTIQISSDFLSTKEKGWKSCCRKLVSNIQFNYLKDLLYREYRCRLLCVQKFNYDTFPYFQITKNFISHKH